MDARWVDRLETKGLVTKAIDPANRRRRIIELTDAGLRRLNEAADVAVAVIDDVQAQFGPDEFRQFVRILRALGDLSPTAGGPTD
jgi:DNA-binding MarR family transcriptional regulator